MAWAALTSSLPGRNSAWNCSRSASSSSAVTGSQCFCLLVPAGVAVLSTSLPPPRSVRDSRGFGTSRLLEHVAARVCREARGTWTFTTATGWTGRKLEVVVDGLPLWIGAPLGTPTTDGNALDVARIQRASRDTELSGENGRARLVVKGTEVGGRWSVEATTFLCGLATAKARDAPFALGGFARCGSAGDKACLGALQPEPSRSRSSRVLHQEAWMVPPLP